MRDEISREIVKKIRTDSDRHRQIPHETGKFACRTVECIDSIRSFSGVSRYFVSPWRWWGAGGGQMGVDVYLFTQVSKFTFGCFITNLAFHLNSVDGHDLNKTVSW